MRPKVVIGNWKMNTDVQSAQDLIEDFILEWSDAPIAGDRVLIVCPPFIALEPVGWRIKEAPKNMKLSLGAQHVHFEENGAYTGEISAAMLNSAGCKCSLVGHSERRRYFGETDETVNKRIRALFKHQLGAVVCIGESLEERKQEQTFDVLKRQLTGALAGISAKEMKNIILAYEPVWAIGTGENATPAQAEETHAFIRTEIAGLHNAEVAGNIPILYGGSLTPENARDIFAQPDVDGGLVGGASLTAESFISIARSF